MKNIYLTLLMLFIQGLLCGADVVCQNSKLQALDSPYFNTSFLRDYTRTYNSLCDDGFSPIVFKTEDNLNIHGLYLTRPQSRYTVICCAGWLPGRKEGMASFYPILPEDCNILLFDARGHGVSDGIWWLDAWWYGQYEYKDIIAAVDFVQQNNENPIILLGICAGAFHATHAVLKLQERQQLGCKRVAGLIFDSGWVSVDTTSCSAVQAGMRDWITKSIAWAYGLSTAQDAQYSFLFSCCAALADITVKTFHTLFFKLPFLYTDAYTNLMTQVEKNNLVLPVLFIHACDDAYVPIDSVQLFAQQIENTSCWWVDKSKHACNHLKYTVEYIERMDLFINTILGDVVCQDTKDI